MSELYLQPRNSDGNGRYDGRGEYRQYRTIAIEHYDNEPCGKTTTENTLKPFQQQFGTQMCFSCSRVDEQWKCPLTGRRNGVVVAAGATWLDSRDNCPKKSCANAKQYSESDYMRTIFYTQGERIEGHLQQHFDLDHDDITSITLCGETLKAMSKDEKSAEQATVGVKKWQRLGEKCTIHVLPKNGKEADLAGQEQYAMQCDFADGLVCSPDFHICKKNDLREAVNVEGIIPGMRLLGDKCNVKHVSPDCNERKGLSCSKNGYCEAMTSETKGKIYASFWDKRQRQGDICWHAENCGLTKEQKENGDDIYCIAHVCVIAGKSIPTPQAGLLHPACREDSNCLGDGSTCLKNSDLSSSWVSSKLLGNKFPQQLAIAKHEFVDEVKDEVDSGKTEIGVCLTKAKDMKIDSTCVSDEECYREGSTNWVTNKPGTRCDVVTHKCVRKATVKPCQPCIDAEANINPEGFCPGAKRAIYDTCERCEHDDDCAPLPDGGQPTCDYPFKSHTVFTKLQLANGNKKSGSTWAGGIDSSAGKKVCRAKKQGGEACWNHGECQYDKCYTPKDLLRKLKKPRKDPSGKKEKPRITLYKELGLGEAYQRTSGVCAFPPSQPDGAPCMWDSECAGGAETRCDLGRMFDDSFAKKDRSDFIALLNDTAQISQFFIEKMMNNAEVRNKFNKLTKYNIEKQKALMSDLPYLQEQIKPLLDDPNYLATFRYSKKSDKTQESVARRKAALSLIPDVYYSGTCIKIGDHLGDGAKRYEAKTGLVEAMKSIDTEASRGTLGRCKNWDNNNAYFLYSGIGYVNIESTSENYELRQAGDSIDPSLHKFLFRLPISIKNMGQSEFLMTPSSEMKFLKPFSDVCTTKTEETEVDHSIPMEYDEFCTAENEYRTIYKQFHQAVKAEHVIRDPCQIIPIIDQQEYIKEDSSFTFFSAPIGQHTVDGTKTVRTNKKIHLCTKHSHNVVENEAGKKSKLASITSGFKDKVTDRWGGDLRCKIFFVHAHVLCPLPFDFDFCPAATPQCN